METYQLKKGEVVLKDGILTVTDDNETMRRNNIILSVILLAVFLLDLTFKPAMSEIIIGFLAIIFVLYFVGYRRGWMLSTENSIPVEHIIDVKVRNSRSQSVVILTLNTTSKIRILRFNPKKADEFVNQLDKNQ